MYAEISSKGKPMKRTIPIALLICLWAMTCAVGAEPRKWTDKSGTFSVEAEFLGLADGSVTLKRADGRTVRIPFNQLSAADQQEAQKLAQPTGAENNPFTVTDEKPASPPEVGTATDDKNTRTVIVEGVGTTPEDALKDAFRTAVRQVVGEVVDAETLAKNDELVKDQVLTYSDAFVPKHKKIAEKRDGGLYCITIQATVERRSLIQKLTTAKIVVKAVDGQSVFGNVVSQLDAEKSADALVRKALEGFPGNCIEIKVLGEPRVLNKDDEKATLQVTIQCQANREAYQAFATRLERTLAAVAPDKGEFSCSYKSTLTRGGESAFVPTQQFDFLSLMPKAGSHHKRGDFKTDTRLSNGKFIIALVTRTSPNGDRLSFSYFVAGEEFRLPFLDAAAKQGKCKLSLLDVQKRSLATDSFPTIPIKGWNWTLLNPFGGNEFQGYMFSLETIREKRYRPDFYPIRWVLIAPVFFCNAPVCTGHQPSHIMQRNMTLSLSEIKQMREVRAELLFENEPIYTFKR